MQGLDLTKESVQHNCIGVLDIRSYKPPLTEEEKAARKEATKKRKKKHVKSEEDDSESGGSRCNCDFFLTAFHYVPLIFHAYIYICSLHRWMPGKNPRNTRKSERSNTKYVDGMSGMCHCFANG